MPEHQLITPAVYEQLRKNQETGELILVTVFFNKTNVRKEIDPFIACKKIQTPELGFVHSHGINASPFFWVNNNKREEKYRSESFAFTDSIEVYATLPFVENLAQLEGVSLIALTHWQGDAGLDDDRVGRTRGDDGEYPYIMKPFAFDHNGEWTRTLVPQRVSEEQQVEIALQAKTEAQDVTKPSSQKNEVMPVDTRRAFKKCRGSLLVMVGLDYEGRKEHQSGVACEDRRTKAGKARLEALDSVMNRFKEWGVQAVRDTRTYELFVALNERQAKELASMEGKVRRVVAVKCSPRLTELYGQLTQ